MSGDGSDPQSLTDGPEGWTSGWILVPAGGDQLGEPVCAVLWDLRTLFKHTHHIDDLQAPVRNILAALRTRTMPFQ